MRKARREGVTVGARRDGAFVATFLRLHTGVRVRKYRLLPRPHAFFARMHDRFAAIGGWHPLAAVHDGAVVAVTVYLRHGSTLYYKFNASDPTALHLRPNDLLLWSGIELATRLGCTALDLGASDDDQPGLTRFKRGFGADEREIRRLAWGPPLPTATAPWRALLADVTQRCTEPSVPDEVAATAGAVLYRYFA